MSSNFIDVATVQERLEDFSALESQISEDPADSVAADQLAMAYEQQGRIEDLLQLLLTRAENVVLKSEKVNLLEQASALCVQTEDHQSALMILLTAFDLDQGNTAIADQLDQLAYKTGQWNEVLESYARAARSSDDVEMAGGLWLRMACTHAFITKDEPALNTALAHIQQVDTAWAQRYLDLVEQHANRPTLVLGLANLCERIGDTVRQTRCLTKSIAMSDSVLKKAEFHSQLASLHLTSEDLVAANWHLREALRLDPKRSDCKAALIAMSKESGDVRTAAEMLKKQALLSGDDGGHAAFEAAQLYSGLEENTQCFDLLHIAMSQDPKHLGAAMPLAEKHYENQRWSELEPLLALLLANYKQLPTGSSLSLATLYYRAGECAQALQKKEAAKNYLVKLLAIDPNHIPGLQIIASVLEELGELPEANAANLTLYNLQISLPKKDQSRKSQSRTAEHIASILYKQSEYDTAIEWAQRAIELDTPFVKARTLLSKIYSKNKDYGHSVRALQHAIAHCEMAESIDLHCQIATIRCAQLDDPMGAIKEYKRALEKDPDNRKVLHRLLDLYSAATLWKESVDTILHIAELEIDPLRKGKYLDAAGDVVRKKLEGNESLSYFNKALDLFFVNHQGLPDHLRAGCMRPFHRIVEYLHQQKDYDTLERNYRKMIGRLSKDDPQTLQLWQELGQIYSKKLDRPEDAIASYEVVSALDENSNHQRVLLGLYEKSEEQVGKAIAKRLEMVKKNPWNPENYSALTEIYLRTREPDRAWCATRALVFLGKSSEAEKSFYYQNKPEEIRWPRIPLNNAIWNDLKHPDENKEIAKVFALIADVMILDSAVDEASLIARDGRTQLHNSLRDLIRGVAYAMGMSTVRVTVDLDLGADLLFLPTAAGPSFVVGRGLWQMPNARVRIHAAARSLSSARPSAQLQALCTTEEHLEAILLGAMASVRSDIVVPAQYANQASKVQKVLQRSLPQARKVQLSRAIQRLLETGKKSDVHSYWKATQCTAERVALLLSSDLQAISSKNRNLQQSSQSLLADILSFSVSRVLGNLRKELNLSRFS